MLAPSGNRPSMLNVITSRRQFLIATAGVAAAVSLPMATLAAESERKFENLNQIKGKQCMNRITTEDGTEIYLKDWGSGQPVIFSHGWPLSADAWEDQMFFLASRGFRCIAHDRRRTAVPANPGTGTYAQRTSRYTRTCWHSFNPDSVHQKPIN